MATSNLNDSEFEDIMPTNTTTLNTASNQKINLENKKVDVQPEIKIPSGKSHHVFISYAEVDQEFAYQLIERLDRAGYKTCHHNKDFTPGWPITDNIKHCVMGSMKTIVILSEGSINSPWCSYETEITLYMSMEMRKRILIPLAIENCKIPDHLSNLTRIEYYNDKVDWWTKLLDALNAADEVPTFDGGVPSISSQAFGYNPHYSNLDFLVEIQSKSSCLIAERIDKRYVPDPLSKRGIQISLHEYETEKKYLNRLVLFRLHCCCYRRIFCISWIVFNFYTFWPIGFIYLNSQILSHGNTGVGVGLLLIPVLFLILFLLSIVIRIKKEKKLQNRILQMNRRMMKHQVMATYKTSKLSAGISVSLQLDN